MGGGGRFVVFCGYEEFRGRREDLWAWELSLFVGVGVIRCIKTDFEIGEVACRKNGNGISPSGQTEQNLIAMGKGAWEVVFLGECAGGEGELMHERRDYAIYVDGGGG